MESAIEQTMYQSQDWVLLKANYYIELAQINSHWNNNYTASIALLEEADKLLTKLTNPKIFEIRQVIAKEISQLKAIMPIDKAGLLSKLDAAQQSVTDLNIQLPHETSATQTTQPPSSNWHSHFYTSLDQLKKLVVVRRDNEDIKPLVSPLLVAAIKETVRLNLQEAQWAVLNEEHTIYQLMLTEAINNIQRTFNLNDHNTNVLLEQLNSLHQVSFSQEKPEIGKALPLINQLIDNKIAGKK